MFGYQTLSKIQTIRQPNDFEKRRNPKVWISDTFCIQNRHYDGKYFTRLFFFVQWKIVEENVKNACPNIYLLFDPNCKVLHNFLRHIRSIFRCQSCIWRMTLSNVFVRRLDNHKNVFNHANSKKIYKILLAFMWLTWIYYC